MLGGCPDRARRPWRHSGLVGRAWGKRGMETRRRQGLIAQCLTRERNRATIALSISFNEVEATMQLAAILASKGDFVATITPEQNVADVVAMLTDISVGALVVSDDGRSIAGIVSERDVVRALASGASALTNSIASIMTHQVYCAPPDASVDDLMHLMTDRRIRHVPITDADGLLLGIVSIGDVVKSRLSELEGERAALLDYITQGG